MPTINRCLQANTDTLLSNRFLRYLRATIFENVWRYFSIKSVSPRRKSVERGNSVDIEELQTFVEVAEAGDLVGCKLAQCFQVDR